MEGNEQMITTEHLPIESAEEFIGLFGFREENLSMFREELDVDIQANSSEILLTGEPEKVALAEFGTLSLEFRYLSKLSGNATYERLVDRIYDCVKTLNHTSGLLPLNISLSQPPRLP